MAARLRWILVPAALAAAAAALAPTALAAGWHPCGDGFGAQCTRVVVPLDRTGGVPGTVPLRVAEIPGPAHPDTLVYLSGGPGSGALDELESVLWSISS